MYFRNLESPSWRPLAGESCMAKAKVKVEQRKPVKLAYIEHTGAYDDIPFETYIGRLYGWAKKAHVRPGFYPLGVFYDSPGETPPEKCRSEIGIPISTKGVRVTRSAIFPCSCIRCRYPTSRRLLPRPGRSRKLNRNSGS